jgi:hypothetical protein
VHDNNRHHNNRVEQLFLLIPSVSMMESGCYDGIGKSDRQALKTVAKARLPFQVHIYILVCHAMQQQQTKTEWNGTKQ